MKKRIAGSCVEDSGNGGFILHYNVDTIGGQSGAPVYLLDQDIIQRSTEFDEDKKHVIGVHVSAGTGGHNIATFITPALARWIKEACDEMN